MSQISGMAMRLFRLDSDCLSYFQKLSYRSCCYCHCHCCVPYYFSYPIEVLFPANPRYTNFLRKKQLRITKIICYQHEQREEWWWKKNGQCLLSLSLSLSRSLCIYHAHWCTFFSELNQFVVADLLFAVFSLSVPVVSVCFFYYLSLFPGTAACVSWARAVRLLLLLLRLRPCTGQLVGCLCGGQPPLAHMMHTMHGHIHAHGGLMCDARTPAVQDSCSRSVKRPAAEEFYSVHCV